MTEKYPALEITDEMIEPLRRLFDVAYEKWLLQLTGPMGTLEADISSEALFHMFLQELRPDTPARPVWRAASHYL